MSLKQELHDRLWAAFSRWLSMRERGATKHDLKIQGLRDCGDPNRYTRNVIFSGNTLRTYEQILQRFVAFAHNESQIAHVGDIGKKEFRLFMDRAIQAGLAATTLKLYGSALSKLGALIGKTEAFAGLADRYARKIREGIRSGALSGPTRRTPDLARVHRAIEVLQTRDARHFDRTGEARAYHLAARLQLETACRRISATERATAASLREGNAIVLVGKSGKEMMFTLSPELHATLKAYLTLYPGSLADAEGYRDAYARAIKTAGSPVTGTHGARRAAAQDGYRRAYHGAVAAGLDRAAAAEIAAGDAIERLGHSRDRRDHRQCYLGR